MLAPLSKTMEIKGAIVKHLPNATGEGKNGPWIKREFILQPPGQYAKPVCIQAFGDKGDVLEGLAEGEEILVHYDLESREYNSRWYTSVNAWKIEVPSTGASTGGTSRNAAPSTKPATSAAAKPTPQQLQAQTIEEEEDLPF